MRSRDALVRSRTQLINHVRGAVKAWGGALPKVTAPAFQRKAAEHIPAELRTALLPLLEVIGELSARIAAAGREVEALCAAYPETAALRQVAGVGPITALTFVLTIEDPARFPRSREVAPYLGLVPRRRDSGGRHTQLGITKRGDSHLRRLLVQAAQYVLGPFGPDCDLRRWGERYMASGAGTRRSARSSPWRDASRCCCTRSGAAARSMSRCVRPSRRRGRLRSGRLEDGEPSADDTNGCTVMPESGRLRQAAGPPKDAFQLAAPPASRFPIMHRVQKRDPSTSADRSGAQLTIRHGVQTERPPRWPTCRSDQPS